MVLCIVSPISLINRKSILKMIVRSKAGSSVNPWIESSFGNEKRRAI